jgi:hypothetical protein
MRIPAHPATCSDLIRPPIPAHPATLAAALLDAIDRRFVETRLGDAGFEIVRDNLRRHPAEK